MCSLSQDVTQERVDIFRLIKTDKLSGGYWKTLAEILLNDA